MVRNAIARLMGRKQPEDRRTYTDNVLFNELRMARTPSADALVTACSNAARIAALTMTRGRVELDGMLSDYWRGVVTDDWIFQAAYDALMYGDAVYRIDADSPTAGMLDRAGTFEVRGKRRPYRYQIEVSHPDGQDTHKVSESEVLHLRLGAEKMTPWRGRSVFHDVLLRRIDKGLLAGARFPTVRAISYPRSTGGGIDVLTPDAAQSKDDGEFSQLSRDGLLTMHDSSTPRGDATPIKSADFQFSPDPQAVELRRDLIGECFAAVGYPPALLAGETPGQTARQEYTRWVVGVLQPVADILAGQIAAGLEVTCTWDMDPARIPLPLDQSTVVKNLAAAGVEHAEALRIAGLS